jgi:hypothetical protein
VCEVEFDLHQRHRRRVKSRCGRSGKTAALEVCRTAAAETRLVVVDLTPSGGHGINTGGWLRHLARGRWLDNPTAAGFRAGPYEGDKMEKDES